MLRRFFNRMLDRVALNLAGRVRKLTPPINISVDIDDEGRLAARVGRRIDEDLSQRVREISKTRG